GCGQPAAIFKKSKRRGANIRKRAADSDDIDTHIAHAGDRESKDKAEGGATANGISNSSNRPAKMPKTSGTSTSTSKVRQRSGSPPQADEGAGSAQSTTADQQPAVEYHFKRAMDSTRTVEPETQDAYKEAAQDAETAAADVVDDTYRGKAGYTNRVSGTGTRRAGPFKAPTNVRSTSVFDYQPNVCKDYKETGYCGYGDSCIFLHDRGTYKSGWQLEKEFEESQAGVKRENPKLWTVDHDHDHDEEGDGDDDDDDDNGPETSSAKAKSEELPFACLICRKPFNKPVVTKCQHYFCEACALKNYRKTPRCFACGAATGGVFKPAKNLIAKG
ncbi:RNA-splicing factor, partial [Coemansia erecta]